MIDMIWQDGDTTISQCARCKHKHRDGPTCRAFPDGIPDAILLNRHNHTAPYPGDNGIRFESVKGNG